MSLPTHVFIPTTTPIPTLSLTPTPISTPLPTPIGIHVLSIPSSPPNLLEILASGLVTAIVILVITVFIDWLRARKRYKSYCALLVSEVQNNFHKIVMYHQAFKTNPRFPQEKFNFEFSIWEKLNHEIAQYVPRKGFFYISAIYLFMKNTNGESCATVNDDSILYIKNELIRIEKILRRKCKKYEFDDLDEAVIIDEYARRAR